MAKRDHSKAAGAVLSEAIDLPASIAKAILTDTYKGLPQLCGQVAANGWPAAAALTAAGAPVAAALICLGGVGYVRWRQAVVEGNEVQAREAELRAHFAKVQDALAELHKDQAAGLAMLEDIHTRRRFVWAKLDANDKQIIADKVTDALRSIGFDGEVTLGEIGATLEEIKAAQEEQATKDDLAAMEQRLLDKIEENKKSQTDPTQQEWPPELIEQAKLLRERGDKEQQAVAEIALRNHEAADAIIQELKRDPIAEAFRILTLEGDNWYQANEPDKAVEPYEQALALRPIDIGARNSVTVAHVSARQSDVGAHRHRAIDIATGTLALLNRDSTDWAMTQGNCGTAWAQMPTGDRSDNLRNAIDAYTNALTIYTRDAHPTNWATTRHNLSVTYAYLAALPGEDRCQLLRRSIACSKAALTVTTEAAFPHLHKETTHNLAIERKLYEAAGCAEQVPFDDIPPAE